MKSSRRRSLSSWMCPASSIRLPRQRHVASLISQYVAAEYRKATAKMQRSYSKKAYPWDNACIESFHALIKREWLNRFRFMTFSRYTVSYLNTSRLFTIRFGLTVIADIFRRINLKGYTKQWHKARNISQLTLTMRINFSF